MWQMTIDLSSKQYLDFVSSSLRNKGIEIISMVFRLQIYIPNEYQESTKI